MESRLTLNTQIRPADDVLFQEIQGEGVLLNIGSGVYMGLDTVGTRFWQLISDHQNIDAVVGVMLDEYDVPRERLERDLLALAARLLSEGLVREVSEA
jgi:hypothetical protein